MPAAQRWRTIDPAEAGDGVMLRLLGAVVAPRPLVLVSTLDAHGRPNVAPFSMVTPLAARPALVGLTIHPRRDGAPKATLVNLGRTGELVINGVGTDLLPLALWCGGARPHDAAGAELAPSLAVRPPRLAASPVQLECRVSEVLHPAGTAASLVIARVERIHVGESVLPLVGHLGMLETGEHLFRTADGVVRGRVADEGPARIEAAQGFPAY